jgi:hypothetical protein
MAENIVSRDRFLLRWRSMMSSVYLLTYGAMFLFAGCCCQSDVPETKKAARSIRLVRELSKSVERLSEDDRVLLREAIVQAGHSRPNGANEALLSFLNEKGVLEDVSLTRYGDIRDVSCDGRLEFIDEWGTPLIVGTVRMRFSRIDIGGKQSAAVVPDAKHPTGILIWSAGPNQTNESGDGDDFSNWRY